MTAKDAAALFRRASIRLRPNVITAELRSGEELLKLCRRYSSGPLTVRDLRRLDHPYARRHPAPLKDARLVNVQSGRFRSSWKLDVPRATGDGGLQTVVENTDPNAAAFLAPGTRLMVPRRPDERAAAEIKDARRARLLAAVKAAFR